MLRQFCLLTMPACITCRRSFENSPDDLKLLQRIGAPDPMECPDCRRQRRLMFRNFFHLYHRTCDLTGKKVLSAYAEGAPFPVYEQREWWGDSWDGRKYGIDVDFNEPLSEQLRTLHDTVPRANVQNILTENCDYCNMSFQCRNCYLMFGNVSNEDCCYGHIVWQSQNCFDCLYCYRCAFCYECIDCVQCHAVLFSRDCDNCADSMFLVHCQGCRHCCGCVGLKNKEYYIFNEPHSREEYQAKLKQLNTGNHRTIEAVRNRVNQLVGKEIVKQYHGFNCENVIGDYLYNCKNIYEGYDLKNCEDCRYSATMESLTDTMDCNFSGAASRGELCFNSLTVGGGYRVFCSHSCMNSCAHLWYCDNCHSCKDCFGCVGLKNKQHCIFNKQCTPDEYNAMLPRLLEHIRKTGEHGQFFPHSLTPFAYNETIASVYFPMKKEEVLARGWRWKDDQEGQKQGDDSSTASAIPDDIREISDTFASNVLRCEATGKAYKIIPQELAFLRQMTLPLPRLCFEERQRRRFALRNPRRLWNRTCAKCGKNIQTTYAPECPETVYCEQCYLAAVY